MSFSTDWKSNSELTAGDYARERLEVTIDEKTGDIKVQSAVQTKVQHFISDHLSHPKLGKFFDNLLGKLEKYCYTTIPVETYKATDQMRDYCQNETHHSLGEIETKVIQERFTQGLDIAQAKEEILATIAKLKEGEAIWSVPIPDSDVLPEPEINESRQNENRQDGPQGVQQISTEVALDDIATIEENKTASATVTSDITKSTQPKVATGITVFKSPIPFLKRVIKCSCLVTLLIASGSLSHAQGGAVQQKPVNDGISASQDLCQIGEMSHICSGNLGIRRVDMPQVEGDVKDNFLKSQTVSVYHTSVIAAELVPVQNEMSYQKVMGMVNAAKEHKFEPCDGEILVASGLETASGFEGASGIEATSGNIANGKIHYVIDGHHRWAACLILGGIQKVISISNTAQHVLEQLAHFPGVTKAGL